MDPVTEPVASLVVPSFRGARRLPVLFDALRSQRFSDPWEVIVVLDGVVDDSEGVIAAADDLPVRIVRFPENRGRPAALNAGFDEARGRVLIRCDDDLEPGPTYVADHVLAHQGPDPVGAVGLYLNEFGDTAYARVYGNRHDRAYRDGAYSGSVADVRYFWAGNCSVTRETFDRVGHYDEAFRAYGWEDIDWGFRLAATGATIVLDPRLETTHHAASVDVVTRLGRAYASGAARLRFDVKHGIERAPGTGGGVKGRMWRATIDSASRRANPDSVERWGRWLDRSIPFLPAPVGYRLISLAADVAGASGRRNAVVSP